MSAEEAGDRPCVLSSLAAWWNGRTDQNRTFPSAPLLKDLSAKIKALDAAGYIYAFIDTPSAIIESIWAVVSCADLVLIPTKPSPYDLQAAGSTVELAVMAGALSLLPLSKQSLIEPVDRSGHSRAVRPWRCITSYRS